MIKKVIIFSENNGDHFNFMKSASSLRLSYMLRKEGYQVKQVHNCLSFTADEIGKIVDKFSEGEEVLACISTSFINTINRKNILNLPGSESDPTNAPVGSFWGTETYDFLIRTLSLLKDRNIKVLVGGWEVNEHKFKIPKLRNAWGIDELSKNVDYFIIGNSIDIIVKATRNETIEFQNHKGSRLVYGEDISDFTDCASTPLLEDNISMGESLSTEIAAGCIFSCQFCNYAALGKKKTEYMRTYESLEREIISNYENFKTRVYLFTDNIMNDYDEKLKFLIRIREKTGIDLRWAGYLRADTIKNKDQARLIAESGVAGATFGIESLKKESGPYIGKMTDKPKVLKSLDIFREAVGENCVVTGSFIAGLPTETEKEVFSTFKWLQSDEGANLIDNYTFSTLTIFDTNKDKNSINSSRNDPFKDYVINGSPSDWTSPWGSSAMYAELAKYFNKERKSRINGFSPPFLHNMGLDIENVVKLGRMHSQENENRVYAMLSSKKESLIQGYKDKLLRV